MRHTADPSTWTLALAGLFVLLAIPLVADAAQAQSTRNIYLVEEIQAQQADTSSWTEIALGEDDLHNVSIPESPFFDDNVTEMTIASEGFLALGPYDGPAEQGGRFSTGQPSPIPTRDRIDGIVALAWSDLDPSACGSVRYDVTNDSVRVAYEAVAYEGELVCELPFLGDQANRVTVWMQLTPENGTVEVHLLRIDGEQRTITGIESPAGDAGNQTRSAYRSLREPTAWRFTLQNVTFPELPELDQDDAGSGGDAGDDLANATAVVPGNFTGTLDPSVEDTADWYVFQPTVDDLVDLTVAPEEDLAVLAGIHGPDGDYLAATRGTLGKTQELRAPALANDTHYVSVKSLEGAGNYTLELELTPAEEEPDRFEPHVVAGVPDKGINPYHEVYHRPSMTEHPCTYLEEYPCDVPALPLSVGTEDLDEALAEDEAVWENVRAGEWYWIPQTNLVAVSCNPSLGPPNNCIISPDIGRDATVHGTATTSSLVSENPDVLLGFRHGQADHEPFERDGIPVDIYSVSWGHVAPLALPATTCSTLGSYKLAPGSGLYVKSSGNTPWSTATECWAGRPSIITVGGAYLDPESEEAVATKQPDVVSYYCRPVASSTSTSDWVEWCGTSFAAPTVAGALSKVLLTVRETTGYTGNVTDGIADPLLGLGLTDLRDAMNKTASYDPEPRHKADPSAPVPRNDPAPWLQWGWGFYDAWVANATVDDLLDREQAAEKSLAARTYMEALHTTKLALYGDPPGT